MISSTENLTPPQSMIHVDNLVFAYPGHEPTFSGLQFQVMRSEAWTVIGPSGCGKTTLLYLLAGLLFPRTGAILVDGSPLKRPRPDSGLVLQDHGLLPWATVWDNASLGLKIRKFYGADGRHAPADADLNEEEGRGRVEYWLGRLGIAHLKGHYPAMLSRGQRQRTAIARTMVLAPDLLLMDEPFSALDAPTREGLQCLMADLHREAGLTCVLVTHDIEEAVFLGEKILALTGGSNRGAEVVENRQALENGVRGSREFGKMCEALRQLLGKPL